MQSLGKPGVSLPQNPSTTTSTGSGGAASATSTHAFAAETPSLKPCDVLNRVFSKKPDEKTEDVLLRAMDEVGLMKRTRGATNDTNASERTPPQSSEASVA